MDRLPDSFLVEGELTLEQVRFFLEQMDRFNKLNDTYNNMGEPFFDMNGDVIFKKGTLIHGISGYRVDAIDNISKTGILTGQAIGKSEDGETYYCADFHRIKDDISVYDYSINFKSNDGRCPFGNNPLIDNGDLEKSIKLSEYKMDMSNSVAFILMPNDANRELLSYDCYRDGTIESSIAKGFINMMPFEDRELGASILYGVPVSCLEGIIVGGNVLQDRQKIEYLISKFPRCYLMTSFGKIIYNPSRGDKLFDELVELRREKFSLERDKRLLERRNRNLESDLKISNQSYDNLWYQMLFNCNNEDIANVLISLGWQGDINSSYVDNMKKGYGR